MSDHILAAYRCDEHGSGEVIDLASHPQLGSDSHLTWVHLDATHPDTPEWLRSNFSHLDSYLIDALVVDETRPRMTQFQDAALLILRGANLNENADPEDMVSIRIWVEDKLVITLRRRKLKAIEDLQSRIKSGKAPKDGGELVCFIMDCLFKRIEPILSNLDETTDDIEESLLVTTDSSLRESIVDVRKKAIMFRRYMIPQREAIERMRMSDLTWLTDKHRRQLQENYNQVTRYVEDLDAVRERSQIVKDELANILSDRLNKNMYMLSVIAAIFLPLGFLTGLLGINVGGIPGADSATAFWVFGGILASIAAVQILIFKWLKWF